MPSGDGCMYCFANPDRCWIHGAEIKYYEPGTNKTPAILNFAAENNIPVVHINIEDISDNIPCTD
jgi:hypothetical protein